MRLQKGVDFKIHDKYQVREQHFVLQMRRKIKMRYVESGSIVIYNREKVKVISGHHENGTGCVILETKEGTRSVPISKIMWNGTDHFVTPEGHKIARMTAIVEEVVQSIKKHMKIWDSENPTPKGFHREEAIDSCFMEWLRNDTADYDNESLGFIVRELTIKLEEI